MAKRNYRRVWNRIEQAHADGRIQFPLKVWWGSSPNYVELVQVVDGEARVRLSEDLQRRLKQVDWATVASRIQNKYVTKELIDQRRNEIESSPTGAFSPNTLANWAIGPILNQERATHNYNSFHFALDGGVVKVCFPELVAGPTPVAVDYFSKTLRFVRKRLDPLLAHESFRIRTPQGNFVMTKAEFEDVFSNVATNEAYQRGPRYTYPSNRVPSKALRFLEKVDGELSAGERIRITDLHDRLKALSPDEEVGPAEGDEDDDAEEVVDDVADLRFRARNVILFGPPGTGKSYKLQSVYLSGIGLNPKKDDEQIFRVTFHPEYSYFDFVGSYKPLLGMEPAERASEGIDGVGMTLRNGKPARPVIYYGFEPGPFAEALVRALADEKRSVALIIEEINRGNCAAIFGDVFQLLDRDASHGSVYPIRTQAPLAAYLRERLGRDLSQLRLPPNLFLYATMNTSDQSLFPMDTAFKRRWNLEYVGISFDDASIAKVEVPVAETSHRSWSAFAKVVNRKIVETTRVDDKQMGPYFVQPEAGHRVSAATFRSKVLFYLWNDALRGNPSVVFDSELTTYDALVQRHRENKQVLTKEVAELIDAAAREDAGDGE